MLHMFSGHYQIRAIRCTLACAKGTTPRRKPEPVKEIKVTGPKIAKSALLNILRKRIDECEALYAKHPTERNRLLIESAKDEFAATAKRIFA